jgi:hypothetical protein
LSGKLARDCHLGRMSRRHLVAALVAAAILGIFVFAFAINLPQP